MARVEMFFNFRHQKILNKKLKVMIISKLDSYRVFKNEEKNLAMQH